MKEPELKFAVKVDGKGYARRGYNRNNRKKQWLTFTDAPYPIYDGNEVAATIRLARKQGFTANAINL